jgi:hypothetical protein
MDWVDNQIVLEFYKRKEKLIIPVIKEEDFILKLHADLLKVPGCEPDKTEGMLYQMMAEDFKILTPADVGYEYHEDDEAGEDEYIPYLNVRIDDKNIDHFVSSLRKNMQEDDCVGISFYSNNGVDFDRVIQANFKVVECETRNQLSNFMIFLLFPKEELGSIVKEIII